MGLVLLVLFGTLAHAKPTPAAGGTITTETPSDPLKSLAVVESAARVELERLDSNAPAKAIPPNDWGSPSQAALGLMQRYGVSPSASQQQQIASLDDLPTALKLPFMNVVGAFLEFDSLSTAAFKSAAYETSPLVRVLLARLSLLEAFADLTKSLIAVEASGPAADTGLPIEPIRADPAFIFDFGGKDTQYSDIEGVALLIDVGGGDTYRNNSGGSNMGDSPTCVATNTRAAALFDLQGKDSYVPNRACGVNGGGRWGSGFLLDVAGDDIYSAGNPDVPAVASAATTGGINGGGNNGAGFLADLSGKDVYTAGSSGTNGGGVTGSGFLFDVAGNDRYTAGDRGTNGGGEIGGGFLLDTGGNDIYRDPLVPFPGNECLNCRIQPKGIAGAQIDTGLAPTVSISDSSVLETGGAASLSITLDRKYVTPLTVYYASRDDTARSPGDYEALEGQVTFAAGQTEANVVVSIKNDLDPEPSESLFVDLLVASEPTLGDASGRLTIMDNDDDRAGISVRDLVLEEGNQESTQFALDLELTAPVDRPVSVDFRTVNGSAVAPQDFEPTVGRVTFQPGETRQSLGISVKGDDAVEEDEEFYVELSNAMNAQIADGRAVVIIKNDDRQLISIDDAAPVKEGNPGPSEPAIFRVSLAKEHTDTQVVKFATADGTANKNDYDSAEGLLEFLPGEMSKTFAVQVKPDAEFEPDENFFATLSNDSGALISDSQGQAIIINDDHKISAQGATVTEGDSSSTGAVFTMRLDSASDVAVSVDYATLDGSATRADGDYEEARGTVTFPPGATQRQVTVLVNGDSAPEGDEVFALQFSNPVNARMLTPERAAKGTIIDDDGYQAPSSGPVDRLDGLVNLPIGPTPPPEPGRLFVTGHASDVYGSPLAFGAGFNPVGAQRILRGAVNYASRKAPAPRLLLITAVLSAFPYQRSSMASLGFPRCPLSTNQAPVPATGCYDIAGDQYQGPERPGASGQGEPPPYPETQPRDPLDLNLKEVNFKNYTALIVASELANGLEQHDLAVLIQRTADICDYVNGGGGLVAFEESRLVNASDQYFGIDEGFGPIFGFLPNLAVEDLDQNNVSNSSVTPVGRRLGLTDADVNGNGVENYFPGTEGFEAVDLDGGGRAISVVSDKGLDCGPTDAPGLSVGDARRPEGNDGSSPMSFPVSLRAQSSRPVSVDYTISDGTAKAGSDFATGLDAGTQGRRGTLVFAPGETAKTIDVVVTGDTEIEPDENLLVSLSEPVNVSINRGDAVGTIVNDDFLPPGPGGTPSDTAPLLRHDAQSFGVPPSANAGNGSVTPSVSQPAQAPVSQSSLQGQPQTGAQAEPQTNLQQAAAPDVVGQIQPALLLGKDVDRQKELARAEAVPGASSKYMATGRGGFTPGLAIVPAAAGFMALLLTLGKTQTKPTRTQRVRLIAERRSGRYRPRRQ